jgi:hypothetical protein|tara:strand:+ start:740 stop:1222 length:483 start_codon:yes stop_codon:yes gene_type:complete
MATTTATITLSSSDIADNALSISNTMTLTNAGTTTGITETTGLARKKMASTTLTDLITLNSFQDITAQKSAKVFIHNTSTSTDKYATIGIGNSSATPYTIGRLYGGDWMLFPWLALPVDGDGFSASEGDGGTYGHASNQDITIDMSDDTETVIEYMVFFE